MIVIVRIRWTPMFGSKRKRIRTRRPGLFVGVLLLAPGLPVCTIADVPPRAVARPLASVRHEEKLIAFMRRKGFAQPYNVPEIMQAASHASIPPSLIVCIEFVESSGGKYYDAETNNPLGWKNGKASFPSVREAIRQVSAELGSGRYYAGKTVEEKLRVYNPRPPYSVKVLDCMSQF
jgi:hypothetical protein